MQKLRIVILVLSFLLQNSTQLSSSLRNGTQKSLPFPNHLLTESPWERSLGSGKLTAPLLGELYYGIPPC
jgi:hypothetical protein